MSVDSFNVPSTLAKKTLSGPLRLITICSDNIEAIKTFYEGQLALEVRGPLDIDDSEKLKSYYGISDDIDIAMYNVETSADANDIQLRVINISRSSPSIKSSASAREVGLLMMDQGTNGRGRLTHSPDQYYWNSLEENEGESEDTLEQAVLNDGQPMLTFVTDQVEEDLVFYTHILGMTLKEDLNISVTAQDLPGLEEEALVRSVKLGAKNGEGSTLRLLSYNDGQFIEQEAAPRLPNQGVTMCSFETADIGEVLARAHAKQIKVYRTPRKLIDPILGEIIAMSLLSPTGSIIEVYSRS